MNWQHFKQHYLIRFWPPLPAVIAAGVLSTYYFGITGTFWAVTGEFTRWGGHLLQAFGLHPENWGYFQVIGLQGSPLDRVDGMMILGNARRLSERRAVGQQRQVAASVAPYPHPAGAGWRRDRRLRCPAGDGLQSGRLLHRHPAVLAACLVLRAGHGAGLLCWGAFHPAAVVPHPGQAAEGDERRCRCARIPSRPAVVCVWGCCCWR